MEIRPARRSELDVICRVLKERGRPLHEARLAHQELHQAVYLIAWERVDPVGHVVLRWPGWPELPATTEFQGRYGCAFVEDLWVRRECRGVGTGRALMHRIESEARARRFDAIGLAVGLDDGYRPARNLYRSLGFRDPGHGPFIESGALPGRPETLWLELLVFVLKRLDGRSL